MDAAEKIGAVILAAGSSSRLGQPKQLLRFGGETLVRRAAQTALDAGCLNTVVVLGAHADLVKDELRDLAVFAVENRRWSDGIGSSICCGVRALLDRWPESESVVLMVCDQPLISAEKI